MRLLNENEQELCLRILNGHGHDNYLGNIIDDKLEGVCISGQRDTGNVQLLFNFWSGGKVPTDEETNNIIQRIEEISLLILETVNLIDLLEKENYILSLQRSPHDETFQFGGCVGNIAKIPYNFPDKKISKLLIEYIQKEFYVTEEFRQFCRHGFISRDERRFRSQNRNQWIAIGVALFAALTSLFFNAWPKITDETKVKEEQLDSVRNDLNTINSTIENINSQTKQTAKQVFDEFKKNNEKNTDKNKVEKKPAANMLYTKCGYSA